MQISKLGPTLDAAESAVGHASTRGATVMTQGTLIIRNPDSVGDF